MFLKFVLTCYLYFLGLNASLFAFGTPDVPLLSVDAHSVSLDITNSVVTGITAILLAVIPIAKMYFKKRWKIKDED